ncbi:MAG: hypothetical protein IJZ93_03915 [Clostridia bacterium]|nr:hypothetical protein [Clostridia bacterium]
MKKYEAPVYEMDNVETSDIVTVSSWTTDETDPVTGQKTGIKVNVENARDFI